MKTTILAVLAACALTIRVAAQSPTPSPTASPTPIPLIAQATPVPQRPVIQLTPQPLTAVQVTAFLTQLSGGTPATPVPIVGSPPVGTSLVRLTLVISGSGTGMIYGVVQ